MGREATDKELSGGVMCDGLGSTLAAMFGVLPNTSFSQKYHQQSLLLLQQTLQVQEVLLLNQTQA